MSPVGWSVAIQGEIELRSAHIGNFVRAIVKVGGHTMTSAPVITAQSFVTRPWAAFVVTVAVSEPRIDELMATS